MGEWDGGVLSDVRYVYFGGWGVNGGWQRACECVYICDAVSIGRANV